MHTASATDCPGFGTPQPAGIRGSGTMWDHWPLPRVCMQALPKGAEPSPRAQDPPLASLLAVYGHWRPLPTPPLRAPRPAKFSFQGLGPHGDREAIGGEVCPCCRPCRVTCLCHSRPCAQPPGGEPSGTFQRTRARRLRAQGATPPSHTAR